MEGRPAELAGSDRTTPAVVRLATFGDVPLLGPVERAAGARFREIGMTDVADDEPPPPSQLAEAVRRGELWVAELPVGDHPDGVRVVGYVWAVDLDGQPHLEQISVLPEAGGLGVGAALVDAVVAWARARGGRSLTLSTFRDVPWNGPWYERLGFAAIPEPDTDPRWRVVREHEAAAGLDVSSRVVMRRPL